MWNKVLPAGLLTFVFVMMPAAAVFAAEATEDENGGFGFSEIIFTILAFVVLVLFIYYMIRDNAK
jgi:hypothetical protein